ncbi:MAG: TolC family protein [Pseudomonadota bacterium]
MTILRYLSVACLGLLITPLHAGYLPDPAAAIAAVQAAPAVQQARAELTAKALTRESLQHGREEWSLSAEAAQRRVETVSRDRYPEWGLALTRPVRLPQRAAADRALGGALAAHAEASLDEALHESGRELLKLWFDWLGEAGQSRLWDAQVGLAETQLAAVKARIRLGEAPRAEGVNAEAALAQARLQRMQALARAQQARARLSAPYPGLPVPADPELPAPAMPAGTADAHVEAVLAHNHEWMRARREAEWLQAQARVLAQRRGADPSVGVFYRNEADGGEHVLGIHLGLTLPGAARRSDHQAAEALSAAAQAAADRIEQRLRLEARADFEAAQALSDAWQQADAAARALEEAARLAARAYELGEGSLDSVLLARRLAMEGRLQAWQVQVAALAAEARLSLDAHRLWPQMYAESEAHPQL